MSPWYLDIPWCNNLVPNNLDDVITLWCDVKIVTPQGHVLFTAFGNPVFELIWSQSMVFKWHSPEILENSWLLKNDKFPRHATGQLFWFICIVYGQDCFKFLIYYSNWKQCKSLKCRPYREGAIHIRLFRTPGAATGDTFELICLKGIVRVFSKMLELFSGRCRWRWLTATTKALFS